MPDIKPQIYAKIQNSDHAGALELALTQSPFAARLIQKSPDWLDSLLKNLGVAWDRDQLVQLFNQSAAGDAEQLKRNLRRVRNQVMLRTLVRDIGGLASLNEVMATMTLLADFSIQTALDQVNQWTQENHGKPEPSADGKDCELSVIGMGKLGGGELNVSSDIDIFFAYPFDGTTQGTEQPLTHHEYFTRVAKQFIQILDDITEDGYVFRVDTRLRPFGASGQLVCNFDMLERYYQTHGRDWERYALIKARVITGNDAQELLEIFRPFVYRKYLDFNAIESLRNLKAQIALEVKRRDMYQNVKLGPGGIREIEFIVQAFQLIRGGRQLRLQTPSTLGTMAELDELELLDHDTCRELRDAYTYLRNIEHRLQYDQDRQIHTLPNNEQGKARLLQLCGIDNWDHFLQKLDHQRNIVESHFEQLLSSGEPQQQSSVTQDVWSGLRDETHASEQLARLGYASADAITQRLLRIKNGRRYKAIPDSSKNKFDKLAQLCIEDAAKTKHPDRALMRSMDLLENISGRSSYLSLFLEHPRALREVHDMVANSPFIASMLNQYPLLLDTLLDERLLYQPVQQSQLENELNKRLRDIERYDVELQMDLLREFKQSYVFKVAAQEIHKVIPLVQISDALSLLADIIIAFVLKLAWRQMKLNYDPKFLVVAYGKLGSKELSYSSDLDIVFLYDDHKKGDMQNYIRFSQRLNHWLTTFTSAGILYQTDLRLRPDGSKGLLAIPIDSFETYQNTRAWMWEHQALSKARWIAGDKTLGQRFDHIRHDILCKQRNLDELKQELLSMRERIRKSKPAAIAAENVKNMAGGIIDVEFIVQYLILAYSHQHPDLTGNIGNIALLKYAATLDIIPMDLAEQTATSYQTFRQIIHNNLLLDPEIEPYSDEELTRLSRAGQALWQYVFAT